MYKRQIQLYTIDAIDLASEIGMGKRNNTILQAAFFSLAKVMPEEEATVSYTHLQTAGQHGLARAGRADEQYVVAACGGDLQRCV